MPNEETPPQNEFLIQKIYTKDLSFEAPNTPEMFLKTWQPEMNLNLQTVANSIEEDVFEVVLTVTVTAKIEEKVAFLCEVQQAGIFTLKNFPPEDIGPIQGSVCPSILFPYAREVVSDLAARGGFPQVYLTPINFDALYAQQLKQDQETKQETV